MFSQTNTFLVTGETREVIIQNRAGEVVDCSWGVRRGGVWGGSTPIGQVKKL